MNLKKILESHIKWINGESDGVKADLQGVDLSLANLQGADLSGAYLQGIRFNFCIGNGGEIKSLQIGQYLISL